ncbi:MAG: hypothetical protein MJ102_06845 [Clostridia bacterium]|nr:hypothetical protein [Clostridia bacterium]
MASFFYDEDDQAAENEPESPPTPLFWRIVGKFFKYSFWALIILINGLVIWRMCFSDITPKEASTVEGNHELAAAYRRALMSDEASNGFAICQPGHDTITNDSITNPLDPEKKITNYGYFSLLNTVIFPSANQIQTVLRYNNSTLEHLKEDYALEFKPDKTLDWYDVTLRVLVDSTPDDPSDNDDPEIVQLVRIKPLRTASASKSLYSYRRFTFHGIPDIGNIIEIYVDIYYEGDVDYSASPYGQLCIYAKDARTENYDLSKKDINAIENAE